MNLCKYNIFNKLEELLCKLTELKRIKLQSIHFYSSCNNKYENKRRVPVNGHCVS